MSTTVTTSQPTVSPLGEITSPVRERRLAGWLGILFVAGITFVLVQPFFAHTSWLILLQDDCFYYLQVARNIANGHGSTFNGLTPTNGYQPLWLWMLSGVCVLTTRPSLLLAFIAVSILLSSAATFLLTAKLLRSTNARPLTVFGLSALATLYALALFFYGMEVILTVPLLLAILDLLQRPQWLAQSPWRTFLLGLLLSALVLSRIDALFFGGLVLLTLLLTPSLRVMIRGRLIVGAVLGLVPVAVYFLANQHFFGTWLPVSGAAKQLRDGHAPSLEPWKVFFHPLAASYALLLLAGMCLLPTVRRRLPPERWVFFPAVVLFPFVYYFALCCVSDWTLWGWYMYPIRTAMCVTFAIFCLWPPAARVLNHTAVAWALMAASFLSLTQVRWRHQQEDITAASIEIADFARSHPGVYAMGDRAGRVAWLIPDPVVQLEGLMMDKPYLSFIRQQMPLRDVLAHYHVRYYIGTAYEPFHGCFEAREPAKGGPTSKKLEGEFCEAPVARYTHDGIETLIFDMKP